MKNTFYEQLHTIQEKLPEGDIVINDLNAKVGPNNTLLGYVMEKRDLRDRDDNVGNFMDFYFHRLVICDILFEQRA